MTKFKRFLSCFLALTMVLGMFSGLGAMFAVDASAAVVKGESQVLTYDEALEEFGSDFIYYAVDVMEYDEDGNPYYTDHYVQPGDTLQIRHYIKMSRFMGTTTIMLLFDSAFFDLKVDGTYPNTVNMVMNPDHDAVGTDKSANSRARGLTAQWTASDMSGFKNNLTKFLGYTDAELTTLETISTTFAKDVSVSTAVIVMKDDDYFGSYDVKVEEGLADGIKGTIKEDYRYWKSTAKAQGSTRPAAAPSDIAHTFIDVTSEDADSGNANVGTTAGCIAAENFHLDTFHEFTIGENPNAGGSGDDSGSTGPAAGESQVLTYDEALEEFGSDFIYYAVDVMEYDEDGNPYYTDHYVQPGDTLQIRHYIKMSRFMGTTTIMLLFDSAFFDLKVDGAYPNTVNMVMNPDHDAVGTDKSANSRKSEAKRS